MPYPLLSLVQILDAKHPGCTIRQLIAGPVTDTPSSTAAARARDGRPESPRGALPGATTPEVRFSCRPASADGLFTGDSAPDDVSPDNIGNTVATRDATSSTTAADVATVPSKKKPPETAVQHEAAPGWEDRGGASGTGRDDGPYPDRPTPAGDAPPGTATAAARAKQTKPVLADGERSFLQASFDGGHSPATAVAAGFDPVASARGVPASVVAEAVKVSFAGAAVVLGPVVGRVTQGSAVILVEVGSTAVLGCVLTDGVTGERHRQVSFDLVFPLHRRRT